MKYYSLENILKQNARYNIVYGERSNGKSYAVWKYAIENYARNGEKIAVIRRMQEDFRQSRAYEMTNGVVSNGEVRKATNGRWDRIYYRAARWYFANKDEVCDEPFGYAFALTSMEHDKSTNYPGVTTILFDEFLTRGDYLFDEFVLFTNVISTIVRADDTAKVFMLGNTVDRYCPYFEEMGIEQSRHMTQGSIDVYEYGDSGLRVAVEYAKSTGGSGKKSDVYFAFNNPKLKMITSGEWELDIYPHLPCKYRPKDVAYTFYIKHRGEVCTCEIVSLPEGDFIYIHKKSTPLEYRCRDIVFDIANKGKISPYLRTSILTPYDTAGERIKMFFDMDKVFYQSNDVGELVRSYLSECQQ